MLKIFYGIPQRIKIVPMIIKIVFHDFMKRDFVANFNSSLATKSWEFNFKEFYSNTLFCLPGY